MKQLPLGISDFSELILHNCVYVDKTKIIYDLLTNVDGKPYYFLSRPRRFGKSLLLSTIKELLGGNKKLFTDTWIYNSDFAWDNHPIVYLDMSSMKNNSTDIFEEDLILKLRSIAEDYNINLPLTGSSHALISELVKKLSKINKVAILIDEYDKPILDNILNSDDLFIAQKIKSNLASFYSVIKSLDRYLKAVFITGVTQFSKSSIFSGLNNLTDLTLKSTAAQICGYTEQEIQFYFQDFIKNFNITDIREWYNGYRFSQDPIAVYNPFSVTNLFKDRSFNNYWWDSGTPTFLIKLIKNQYYDLENLSRIPVFYDEIKIFEVGDSKIIPVLFQTGYLTISKYLPEQNMFLLDYPNKEVKISFSKLALSALTGKQASQTRETNLNLIEFLQNKNLENFCTTLKQLFANIPYTLLEQKESYFHSIFQIIMTVLGLDTNSEVITNNGRIDVVIKLEKIIYIFELKVNSSANIALKQIIDKSYYEKYLLENKDMILVGLNFKTKPKFDITFSTTLLNKIQQLY